MNLAPITLFVYNRLWHTQQTIIALQENDLASNSELYIYSDGPKNESDINKVEVVRNYIKTINNFKKITIIEREYNWGLAKSIIQGVTEIVKKYDKIIVLEDDMVTSKYFLKYMNDALEIYKDNSKIISIHAFFYPINVGISEPFFLKGADCWGWGTWKRGWDLFEPNGEKLLSELKYKKLTREFDFGGNFPFTKMLEKQISGKNDSWAIRWYASAFLKDKLTLYPAKSLLKNIGNDSSGTHSSYSPIYDVNLSQEIITNFPDKSEENQKIKNILEFYFKKNLNNNIFRNIFNYLKFK